MVNVQVTTHAPSQPSPTSTHYALHLPFTYIDYVNYLHLHLHTPAAVAYMHDPSMKSFDEHDGHKCVKIISRTEIYFRYRRALYDQI